MKLIKYKYSNTLCRKLYIWNECGFTLLELLVTIAIGAILLSVGLPNLTNLYKSARLSAQSDLLVSSLNQARLEAIKRRATVSVCSVANPDTATACPPVSNIAEINAAKGYWSNGWIVISGITVSHRVSSKSGVLIDSVSAPVSVNFTGTLGSVASSSSFKLCGQGQLEQQINVSMSGHISKNVNSNSVCL